MQDGANFLVKPIYHQIILHYLNNSCKFRGIIPVRLVKLEIKRNILHYKHILIYLRKMQKPLKEKRADGN